MAALGLASGIVLVLLLLCLYRVLCPRNYGQPGGGPGRRRRGDLPCDDYGYAPPETEIVPLVLRGHLMVSVAWGRAQATPASVRLMTALCPTGHRVPGQRRHAAGELLPGRPRVRVGRTDRGLPHTHPTPQVGVCRPGLPIPAVLAVLTPASWPLQAAQGQWRQRV